MTGPEGDSVETLRTAAGQVRLPDKPAVGPLVVEGMPHRCLHGVDFLGGEVSQADTAVELGGSLFGERQELGVDHGPRLPGLWQRCRETAGEGV